MSSIVSICNTALTSLGANPIVSLNDGTTEALLCDSTWSQSRRAVLRLHPWNFAIKRTELAAETTAPVYDYKYSYPLPADCIRVIQVFNNQDYRVERKRIITNSETCFVKYIYDNEDIGNWEDSFIDLMSARIRLDLAYAITRSNSSVTQASALFQEKFKLAKAIDASEDIQEPFGHFDNSLIAARF